MSTAFKWFSFSMLICFAAATAFLALILRQQQQALHTSNEELTLLRSAIAISEQSRMQAERTGTAAADEATASLKRIRELEEQLHQLEKVVAERNSLRKSVAALQTTLASETNANVTKVKV